MKILYITDSLSRNSGGVFDAARNLAIGVSKTNPVSVLGRIDDHWDEDSIRWEALSVSALKSKRCLGIEYLPKLSEAVNQYNPDLIHFHGLWLYPSIWSSIALRGNKIPYIVSPHGMLDTWALSNSRLKKRAATFLYEKRNLSRSSCIHALCKEEHKSIRDYGLKNPVCIIPNGVELQKPNVKMAPLWKKNMSKNRKIMLFLGRIHPKKGLVELINAWKNVNSNSASSNKWMLVIAGWDQQGHESELIKLASELNISSSVLFVGPQFGDDRNACLMNADAFVLPSFSEGLPMTVLEAWSFSLPVLMTHQCNLPQGKKSGAAIYMNTNVNTITQALNKIFDMSEKERIQIGQNGKELVKMEFSWSQVTESMNSVYKWLVEREDVPECIVID